MAYGRGLIRRWTTPSVMRRGVSGPSLRGGPGLHYQNWLGGDVLQGRTYWILILSPWYWHCTAQNHNVLIMPLGQRTAGEASAPGDSIPHEDDVTDD